MNKPLLKATRKQLWRFRFMLWWRTLAISVGILYFVCWLYSPFIIAAYTSKHYPKAPSFVLGFFSVSVHIVNVLLICTDEKHNLFALFWKTFCNNRKQLKHLITHSHIAVNMLKKKQVQQLDFDEFDTLCFYLSTIGVGVSEHTGTEAEHTESEDDQTSEQLSMFDVFGSNYHDERSEQK